MHEVRISRRRHHCEPSCEHPAEQHHPPSHASSLVSGASSVTVEMLERDQRALEEVHKRLHTVNGVFIDVCSGGVKRNGGC